IHDRTPAERGHAHRAERYGARWLNPAGARRETAGLTHTITSGSGRRTRRRRRTGDWHAGHRPPGRTPGHGPVSSTRRSVERLDRPAAPIADQSPVIAPQRGYYFVLECLVAIHVQDQRRAFLPHRIVR